MSVRRKGWVGSPPGQKRTIQTLTGLLAFGLLLPSGMALAVPEEPLVNDDGVVQTVEPAETPLPVESENPAPVEALEMLSPPEEGPHTVPASGLADQTEVSEGIAISPVIEGEDVVAPTKEQRVQVELVAPLEQTSSSPPANWNCYKAYGRDCISQFGYTGASTWGYPVDSWGNNCTNYVAFRLERNEAQNPGNFGNAVDWAANARAKNFAVNQTASVGAIAQWTNSTYGHVAYIDWVSPDGSQIAISESSYDVPGIASSSGRRILNRGTAGWPNNIIHMKDLSSGEGSISDGSFISYEGHVYRVAGGAPIYVSTWNVFGGAQPTTPVSAAQFAALRKVPADGTFLVSAPSGHVYRVVGGAPIYVSSWNPFGGGKPTIAVDEGAINNAGAAGVYSHLNKYPADGTTISGASSGRVYVIAGGAPLYISSWNAVGGPRTAVSVDDFSIDRAGNGGLLSNLRKYPADGTYIQVIAGHVFVFAGGFPVHVDSWSAVGGGKPTTLIDQAVIDRAGDSAVPYTNVRASMADGTYVHALDWRVHRAVGGALFYLNSWQAVGGQKPSTLIPEGAIKNPGTGLWKGIRTWPTEGSVARTLPSGAYYKFTGSTCVTTSATDSAVVFGDGVLPCPTKVEGPTPTISGSAVVGEKLTTKAGEWKPTPVTLAYQWLRDGSAISGATKTTYTLTNADVGKSISVTVTGSKEGYTTTSKTSTPTAKIQAKTATKAGWVQENGKWYYYANGVKNTGWLSTGGAWYYMNSSGVMQTGWVTVNGTWYYMSPSGAMQTGWVAVSGTWYLMSPSGAMQTGWVSTGGAWYYMKASGAMHTGWLKLGSAWFYLKPSGAMVTGTYVIDGATHRFNSSGVWLG